MQFRKERIIKRYLRDLLNPMELPDITFVGQYRLNKRLFVMVVDEVAPLLGRSSIPSIIQVAAVLQFLRVGSFHGVVANDININMGRTTFSKILWKVFNALEDKICPIWINTEIQDQRISIASTLGFRHVQGLLIFFNLTVVYISRLGLSVSVVAMTHADSSNPDYFEFDWSEREISYVLSSFFWGYIFTQFLSGIMCRCFGTKKTMSIGTFGSILLEALTPTLIMWGGWKALCTVRVLMGLCQGIVFPCMFQHLAKWAPTKERNRLCAFSLTGAEFGMVCAPALAGSIAAGPWGWPGVSYASAGLCMIWLIFWIIFAANNPTESWFISEAEREYIETSMGHNRQFHRKNIPVPWKAIVTSSPFIALLITRGSIIWSCTTLQTQIPSYLHGVFDMEIKSNALFTTLPFVIALIMSYVFIFLAEVLIKTNYLSLRNLRRSFNTVGSWTPAVGLIIIGFLSANHVALVITVIVISVGMISGGTIGSGINCFDLSPNHAGILIGIVNTFVIFMSLLSTLIVGVIVINDTNRYQWQIVFAISASFFFFGNLIYIIFGAVEVQPWDAEDFKLSQPLDAEEFKLPQVEAAPSKAEA